MPDPIEHDATSQPAIEQGRFRQVLGHFPSGVTVITGIDGGEPVGLAVGSFCSVSLDPPLVSFCAGHDSRSWPLIRDTGRFCVNILAADQEPLSRQFATRGAEKFAGVGWTPSAVGGAPRLADVLAWIDCTVEAVHPAGDHDICVGRVQALDVGREAGPLVFYRGGYGRFEP